MPLPTRAELKDVWLRCAGFDRSPEDRWLRHKIALLYDLARPDDEEEQLLNMADLRSTLLQLAQDAYPEYEAKLRETALAFFRKRGLVFPA